MIPGQAPPGANLHSVSEVQRIDEEEEDPPNFGQTYQVFGKSEDNARVSESSANMQFSQDKSRSIDIVVERPHEGHSSTQSIQNDDSEGTPERR